MVLFACLFTTAIAASAQTKTYIQKGFTLNFTNTDATIDSATYLRWINTFFEIYPKEAAKYNEQTNKVVFMIIDTAYKGVAATGNAHIRINPTWIHQHPEDIDVVTHEAMHIVQSYGRSVGPGWLTEGIADYVRNEFGVNNAAAKWTLGEYKAGQNYTNSYRITAHFLLWADKKVKPGLVKELDKQLRDHTYTADTWKQQTNKTLDELWQDYVSNPAI